MVDKCRVSVAIVNWAVATPQGLDVQSEQVVPPLEFDQVLNVTAGTTMIVAVVAVDEKISWYTKHTTCDKQSTSGMQKDRANIFEPLNSSNKEQGKT